MARKIYLTSFKGGTGVTTCAVGLGVALAAMGERTLIVDGDFRCCSAAIIGECRDLQVYTLGDYERGACRIKSNSPSTSFTACAATDKSVMPIDGIKHRLPFIG